jgi:hypothetical protein
MYVVVCGYFRAINAPSASTARHRDARVRMGRIREYFVNQGLDVKDLPAAFVCVRCDAMRCDAMRCDARRAQL